MSKFTKKAKIDKKKYTPKISILIAVHNEENLIRGCIDAVYKSEYPRELYEVIVGIDGATDKTEVLLADLSVLYENLSYFFYKRQGKNKVLNEISKFAFGEILLFLDADCRPAKNAILNILGNFNDPTVGAVVSKLILVNSNKNTGQIGESLYQKYESKLRKWESTINSNINSSGTLYGVRKELFDPFPNDFICDDFYNLLNVASKNYRIIYDDMSITYEVRRKSLRNEFSRRIRLVSGGISTINEKRELLQLSKPWFFFSLFSHKIFRWASPIFNFGLIFISIFYLSIGYFILIKYFLLIYLSFMFLGLIGFLIEILFNKSIPVVNILSFYVNTNLSFLFGFFRYLNKKQNAIWNVSGLENVE